MKNFTLSTFVVLLLACNNDQQPLTDQVIAEPEPTQPAALNNTKLSGLVSKLLGEWNDIQADGKTVFHEQWRRTDDAFYAGLGFVMSGTDTVFIENLHIAWDAKGANYSARIPSQNGGEYVDFALTSVSNDSMVFENPVHDFPQRIAYSLQGDSIWNVVVSGVEEGKARMERFHFTRRAVPAN